MTDVTQDWGQAGAELPAADEQVLRELTERAGPGRARQGRTCRRRLARSYVTQRMRMPTVTWANHT